MSKQALIKLATLRLAINYVLRNRYLTKQGFVKQAIGPGAGTTRETAQPGDSVNNPNGLIPPINTDPNRQNFPSMYTSSKPVLGYIDGERTSTGWWRGYPELEPANKRKSARYNSIKEFKESNTGETPVLYPGDTVILPRKNLLVNNNNKPIYLNNEDLFLNNIFRSEQELADLAPFAPFGHVHIQPQKVGSNEGGHHESPTNNIFYTISDNPKENRDSTTHEPNHTPTVSPRYVIKDPYETEIERNPSSKMSWKKGVERYTREENSTMGQQGARAMSNRPITEQPNYLIFTRTPYMWNMPTSFKSPYGRIDKSKPITDKEWLSYTLPKKNIGFKTVIEEPEWPRSSYSDDRENVTYELLNSLYNTGYLTPENFFPKIESATLDKLTDKNMKDMGWYIRSNLPDYKEKEKENENGDKIKEFEIPISIFDAPSAKEIKRFIEDHNELNLQYIHFPKNYITNIALNNIIPDIPEDSQKEPRDPLTNYEKEVNNPLIGNSPNYQRFLIREALGNLTRRGINIIGKDHSPLVKAQAGDITAHAPMQGLSQQRDPYTRNTYTKLQKQVLSKLQEYDKNPRYFNIMKKWHLSPFGDSMLGVNQFSLTIEQMKQILKDFEKEDKNQKLEKEILSKYINPKRMLS